MGVYLLRFKNVPSGQSKLTFIGSKHLTTTSSTYTITRSRADLADYISDAHEMVVGMFVHPLVTYFRSKKLLPGPMPTDFYLAGVRLTLFGSCLSVGS